MSTIIVSSKIGPVPIDCIISEDHTSALNITKNAVEYGANINDHAYVMPKKISLQVAGNNAVTTYDALVSFQKSRTPFTLVTGLSIYNNMLVQSISVQRDKKYANILNATIDLEEVVIVNTSSVTIDIGDIGDAPRGKQGGKHSTRAVAPSHDNTSGAKTKDRSTSTIQRGDTTVVPVPDSGTSSILLRAFS